LQRKELILRSFRNDGVSSGSSTVNDVVRITTSELTSVRFIDMATAVLLKFSEFCQNEQMGIGVSVIENGVNRQRDDYPN
jgi:hypothetical protein